MLPGIRLMSQILGIQGSHCAVDVSFPMSFLLHLRPAFLLFVIIFHVPESRGDVGASQIDSPLRYWFFIHFAHTVLSVIHLHISFNDAALQTSESFLMHSAIGLQIKFHLHAFIFFFQRKLADILCSSLRTDLRKVKD